MICHIILYALYIIHNPGDGTNVRRAETKTAMRFKVFPHRLPTGNHNFLTARLLHRLPFTPIPFWSSLMTGPGQTGSSQTCRNSPEWTFTEKCGQNVRTYGKMWQHVRTKNKTWQHVMNCGPSVKTLFVPTPSRSRWFLLLLPRGQLGARIVHGAELGPRVASALHIYIYIYMYAYIYNHFTILSFNSLLKLSIWAYV